jgi:hypothetical protein
MTGLLLFIGILASQVPEVDAGSDLAPTPEPDADVAEANPADVAPDGPATPEALPALGRLRGQVLAKGLRAPVLAAEILVGPLWMGETDNDGRFDIAAPCGAQPLTVRAPGYATLTLKHDPCADALPLRLRLVPHQELPTYETVVKAQHETPNLSLQGPALTTMPGSLGDPFRIIESLPGVATVAWPAPIYAIRGANPGNTGFFLDDLQVPALFHMALGPSVIHPYFFANMDFYPGGYPARYGRYVAGLVTAQTRPPAEDRLHAVADVRLYDAGALVSVPWADGKGGVVAALRYSYTGALLSLLQNDLRLAYWDYQLRADRRMGDWRMALLLMGSSDDLAYQSSPNHERKYQMRFHRVNLRVSRPIGAGHLMARLAAGADYSQAPVYENFPVTINAYSLMPRVAYQWTSTWVDWETGIDGQVQWFRPQSSLKQSGISDMSRKRTARLLAGYASATFRAGSRLSLTPGLRLDSYTISDVNKMDLGPRLSARLLLDALTWLSASAGRFSQTPSIAIQIPGAENFGLQLYGLQTSWQAALGVGTKHLRGFAMEVTGYLQRYVLTDLQDPLLLHPNPLSDTFLVRRDALSYGLELMVRLPPNQRLHGWLSYTLSQNRRTLEGGSDGPSDWDQRHIANALLGYRIGRTTLGARGHLNTGRPVSVTDGQPGTYVRLPAFYQLDLRVERRIIFDSFTLDLYLEIANATLTREVFRIDREASGALTERSYRIVLPSLGIRGEI